MKRILIVFSILLATFKSKADCSLGRIEFWPTGVSVPQNPIFLIEGYALSQKIILKLNQDYPVYLKSLDEKIVLQVQEVLIGEAGLTQAILLPAKELIPGEEYQLYIDNIPKNEMPSTSLWNPETSSYAFPSWKVDKGNDIEKPIWKIKPKESKKTYIQFGCGPEYYVYFDFQAMDQSAILIKTSVTSVNTNKTIVVYLKPEDNSVLKVGRGMCGGAFSFNDGDLFGVTFDIMDANGNITKWSGNAMTFAKPTVLR